MTISERFISERSRVIAVKDGKMSKDAMKMGMKLGKK